MKGRAHSLLMMVARWLQACGMVVDHPVGSPQWRSACERLEIKGGESCAPMGKHKPPAGGSCEAGGAFGGEAGPAQDRAKKRRL